MHRFPLIFSLFTLNILFIQHLQAVAQLCAPFSCNKHIRDTIRFPFWVPKNRTSRCGYPGFELSCNSDGQTLFPMASGHLIVQGISYPEQFILLSDPKHCMPKRVHDFSFDRPTPFMFDSYGSSYTTFKCSKLDKDLLPRGTSVISCMSDGNHTVVAAFDHAAEAMMMERKSEWKCVVNDSVTVPIWWPGKEYGYYPMRMSDVFLQLSWDFQSCVDCMLRGGSCGFLADSGLEVACYIPASSGLPKSAKYGLILGAGIPGLLCIIGLTFYISSRVSARNQNRRYTNTESSPSIFPQPIILTLGLNVPTIESYPKTILGESKRLPKACDNICPICLSEYQPKETLRSIPDCNHYYHADCIDEWLRMNATCPLCRNSPQ